MTPYEQAFRAAESTTFTGDTTLTPRQQALWDAVVDRRRGDNDHTPTTNPATPTPTTPSEAPVAPSEATRQWVQVEPTSIYQAGFKYAPRKEPAAMQALGIILLVALAIGMWFLRAQPGDPPPDVPVEVMEQWNCGEPYPESC